MRDITRVRRGIAVPLAVIVVVALALLSALVLDAALGALRADSAAVVEARAGALAEAALARALALRVDTSALRSPAGTVLYTERLTTSDTVAVALQVLAPTVARVVVTASTRQAQFRGFAGRYAFATMVVDTTVPVTVSLVPLPSNWWVAVP